MTSTDEATPSEAQYMSQKASRARNLRAENQRLRDDISYLRSNFSNLQSCYEELTNLGSGGLVDPNPVTSEDYARNLEIIQAHANVSKSQQVMAQNNLKDALEKIEELQGDDP